MKQEILLSRLGLNTHEVRLYLALLQLPGAGISDLHRETGMYRPLIYRTLPLLIEKGLAVKVVKGKRKQYSAESPDKLAALVTNLTKDLEETLPDLKEMYQARTERPSIKYFEGRRGVAQVYTDIVTSLKRDDVFYRYSSAAEIGRVEKYIPAEYKKVRDKKELQRFVISSAVIAARTPKDMNRATKVVPPEPGIFESNITQIIYGNKTALIDYNTETALVIENAKVAAFQKEIFKLLYKYLPGSSR